MEMQVLFSLDNKMILIDVCITKVYNTDCYKKYSSVIKWRIWVKKKKDKVNN